MSRLTIVYEVPYFPTRDEYREALELSSPDYRVVSIIEDGTPVDLAALVTESAEAAADRAAWKGPEST